MDANLKRPSTPQDFEQQETVDTNIETVRIDQKIMYKKPRKIKNNKKAVKPLNNLDKNMSIDMTENSIFGSPIQKKTISLNVT